MLKGSKRYSMAGPQVADGGDCLHIWWVADNTRAYPNISGLAA
jgi:hypothetical protein